jgi:hypothetical protein
LKRIESVKVESLVEFGRRKVLQAELFHPDMSFANFIANFVNLVPVEVSAEIRSAAPATPEQLNRLLSELEYPRQQLLVCDQAKDRAPSQAPHR